MSCAYSSKQNTKTNVGELNGKIIYMGEFDGRNYYYNIRTKEGLVALDSETIKKKGERNEYLSTLIMILFWLFLILEALMFLIPVFHGMYYPKLMITPFIMLSIVTPLLYILFMECISPKMCLGY